MVLAKRSGIISKKRGRFSLPLVSLILSTGILLPACGEKPIDSSQSRSGEIPPPAATQPMPSDGVRRVTIPELRDALEKGEAIVVDVRGEVDYKLGHIQGARSLPLGLIAEHANELTRDKLIVTYCA